MSIIRYIILIILIFFIYYILKSMFLGFKRRFFVDRRYFSGISDIDDEMVKDPYCSVYVPKKNALKHKSKKGIIFFCSKDCMEKYLISNPES